MFVFLNPMAGALLISLDPVFRQLGMMGFDQFDEEGIVIHGFPVQFLAASPGLETEAIAEAQHFEWDEHRARVITPEHSTDDTRGPGVKAREK